MKRPRPYIPLSVRVAVAERQVRDTGSVYWPLYLSAVKAGRLGMGKRLSHLLSYLLAAAEGEMTAERMLRMGDDEFSEVIAKAAHPHAYFQLDHDPALILRPFNPRTGRYTPDANDPNFLTYLDRDIHLQKTTGRRPGALKTVTGKDSDVGLAKKFRRLEGPPKRKAAIPQRKNPWPKRSFGKRTV